MSDVKHTPGPWEWSEEKSRYGGEWLFAGDEPVLDYAGCGSHDTSAYEADRCLIAAAPEMLAALKKCHAELHKLVPGSDVKTEAWQTIAKAEGRSK